MAASRKDADAESVDAPTRKKRGERSGDKANVTLTPLKLDLLRKLNEYRFLLGSQTCKLTGLSEQAVRRHMRELFDAELADRAYIPRAAIAEDDEANDISLTHGSDPLSHAISKKGIQELINAGIVGKEALKSQPFDLSSKNWLFLRHEIFIRDIRIWTETLKDDGVALRSWRYAYEAEIVISKSQKFRPDAHCVIDIGERAGRPCVLSAFIEADRGTERGLDPWAGKLSAYAALFNDPEKLVEATGFRNARVLVVTTTEARRDWIWRTLEDLCAQAGAGPELMERFWIAGKSVLEDETLGEKRWRLPRVDGLWEML